jgi:hypothetical protein
MHMRHTCINKKGNHFHDCLFVLVDPTGEMSNQIYEDLIEIYNVAKKLKL